jgi:hypothetical protein
MPRSCSPSPSFSHFFAIEVVRIGQSVLSRSRPPACRERALAQVEVLGLAHFEVGGAGDRRARVDQVGRVKLLGAVLALVAAGALVAAVRAGALDVAVGQEAAVGLDGKTCFSTLRSIRPFSASLPAKCWVSAWFCWLEEERPKWSKDSRKPSERSSAPVHLGAVVGHRLAGLGGGKLGRGAVFVGGAEEHHLVPAGAVVAGVKGRRAAGCPRGCPGA